MTGDYRGNQEKYIVPVSCPDPDGVFRHGEAVQVVGGNSGELLLLVKTADRLKNV